jgi:hypothetical protein
METNVSDQPELPLETTVEVNGKKWTSRKAKTE